MDRMTVPDPTTTGDLPAPPEPELAALAVMVDCAPTPVLYVRDGLVQRANPAFVETYGYRPGRDWPIANLLAAPAGVERFRAEVNGELDAGRVFRRTVQVRRADGALRWTVFAARAVVTGRRDLGSIWTVEDTQARHDAEEALRASEERYRLLFDAHPLPMWVSDPESHAFLAVNDAAVRRYGWSREEFLGLRLEDIRPPDEVPRLKEKLTRLHPGIDRAGHWRHRTRNGEVFTAEVTALTLRLGGRLAQVVLAQDVTERLRQQDVIERREREFRDLAENAPDVIVRFAPDGTILYVNRAVTRYGVTSADRFIGRHFRELPLPEGYRNAAVELSRRAFAAGEAHRREIAVDLGERTVWFDALVVPEADAAGLIESVLWVGRDITEHREAREQLRLYAQVFTASRHGILITDPRGLIVAVNDAFTEITGWEAAEVVGRTPALLASGRHDARFYAAMWAQLEAEGHWKGEVWNRRRTGEVYPESLLISAVRDETGAVLNYIGQFQDISDRKQAEARIRHMAQHDQLTDLPNRALLIDRAGIALSRARRSGGKAAVLFVDLDQFKTVNDSLGHGAGDEMLKALARRYAALVRASDTVSRQGGDEFVVLLEDVTGTEDAARVAAKLIAATADPVEAAGRELRITASVGVALYPDNGEDLETLLRGADTAMYAAKSRGRNRFAFYASEMDARATERLGLENDLRVAIEQAQLALAFQPQLSLRGRHVVGFEALLRWRHPARGAVPPARFIPIAEDSGLIVPLGEWVLREACATARAWLDAGLPFGRIAVNVSALQLRQPDFGQLVREALAERELPARHLEIEITESVLMDPEGEARARMDEIAALGVGLALDDFGTGYSSLAYLRDLRLDRLKIDQSFVRDLAHGPRARDLLRGIVELGHGLGITVVAEGVETGDEASMLERLACDEAQGYHFGHPAARAEVEAFLARAR